MAEMPQRKKADAVSGP